MNMFWETTKKVPLTEFPCCQGQNQQTMLHVYYTLLQSLPSFASKMQTRQKKEVHWIQTTLRKKFSNHSRSSFTYPMKHNAGQEVPQTGIGVQCVTEIFVYTVTIGWCLLIMHCINCDCLWYQTWRGQRWVRIMTVMFCLYVYKIWPWLSSNTLLKLSESTTPFRLHSLPLSESLHMTWYWVDFNLQKCLFGRV